MGDIITQQLTAAAQARADSVVSILTEWAEWMQRDDSGGGYPARSAGFGQCVSVGTFEDMCDHADALRVQVVDSCVSDLPPNQNAAIYRRYLAAVFRMRDYEGSLMAAHETLERMLKNKGMVW